MLSAFSPRSKLPPGEVGWKIVGRCRNGEPIAEPDTTSRLVRREHRRSCVARDRAELPLAPALRALCDAGWGVLEIAARVGVPWARLRPVLTTGRHRPDPEVVRRLEALLAAEGAGEVVRAKNCRWQPGRPKR